MIVKLKTETFGGFCLQGFKYNFKSQDSATIFESYLNFVYSKILENPKVYICGLPIYNSFA